MGPFSTLPLSSKLWVYASNRNLSEQEVIEIQQKLTQFTRNWTSHEMPLQAESAVFYNRIVLIAVNEDAHAVGGCGIDKSVQVIKSIGATHQINFFDRLMVLVQNEKEIVSYNKATLQEAINHGLVNKESRVFNPMVQSIGEFNQMGFVALQDFWMAPQLTFPISVPV
jgi:hypothetical protein